MDLDRLREDGRAMSRRSYRAGIIGALNRLLDGNTWMVFQGGYQAGETGRGLRRKPSGHDGSGFNFKKEREKKRGRVIKKNGRAACCLSGGGEGGH